MGNIWGRFRREREEVSTAKFGSTFDYTEG